MVHSSYAYGYLLGALFVAIICVIFLLLRPDLRREMVYVGLLASVGGIFLEYFLWTRDWWHPPTMTGTRIGLEDVIYALSTGGIMASIVPLTFRRPITPGAVRPPVISAVLPYACATLIAPALVALTGLHSFLATTIGTTCGLILMLTRRRDLVPLALWSGLLSTLASLPVYWAMELLLPGVVEAIWDIKRLSGLTLTGIPLEDIAWYFYSAAFFGAYYKYVMGQSVCQLNLHLGLFLPRAESIKRTTQP